MKKATKHIGVGVLFLLVTGCAVFEPTPPIQSVPSPMWVNNPEYKEPHAFAMPYGYPGDPSAPRAETYERGNYYKAPPQYHPNQQDEEKFSQINARVQERQQKIQENKNNSANATSTQIGQSMQSAPINSSSTMPTNTAPNSTPAATN